LVRVLASADGPPLSSRIWLVSERAGDERAAELLRVTGAEVTVVRDDEDATDSLTHESDSRPVVVMTSSRKGRSLLDRVEQVSADRSDRVTVDRSDRVTILICDQVGPAEIRRLVHLGIRGIVLREQMAQTLVPAVAAAASGQVCVPSQGVVGVSRPVLSIREKQVMGLVAMGLMNIEIARRLFLAESTVKSHLSSAFSKLGVRSRHEAVELLLNPASGLGLGILSLDDAGPPGGSEVADLK
jgi:DNA-binding NarL/FixJ family response regulator